MLKTVSTANGLISPTFSGNVTLSTGNLVPGTAAKGVNFTANTPAAGMTSQLLNWYEEGTWTPTVTTDTVGDLTVAYTNQYGTYTRIGRMVKVIANLSYTPTYTTASGAVRFALPYTTSGTQLMVVGNCLHTAPIVPNLSVATATRLFGSSAYANLVGTRIDTGAGGNVAPGSGWTSATAFTTRFDATYFV
jgi:hypothetical protein